jgi:bifunctional DNase/RNase
MIPLKIDRFNEDKRILALKEVEGDRYLFIGFGEKEAAEIGRALRFEPASPDASRATWMEMVEERGANVDAIAITDLVDGGFRAIVQLTQDGRSFDLSARPVDAIAWAALRGTSLFACEGLTEITSVILQSTKIESIVNDELFTLARDEYGSTIKAYVVEPPRFSTLLQPFIAWSARPAFLLFGILTVAIGVLVALSGFLNGSPEGWLYLAFSINGIGLCLMGMYGSARFHAWLVAVRKSKLLEVRPGGLVFDSTIVWMTVPWSKFSSTGKLHRRFKSSDGLFILNPPKRRFKGIALHQFDRNWRNGEIGRHVRRFRPQVFGAEPDDLDGGHPIF